MPDSRQRLALTALRITGALLMLAHGVARTALGIVDDFGGFLGSEGVPLPYALAWLVTAIELTGGPLLALGVAVRPLAGWFVVQLMAGIWLVHLPDGWFVVGAGRNGVEYSVLLIVVFAAVGWTAEGQWRVPSLSPAPPPPP